MAKKEKTYDDAYEIILNGFFVSLAPNPEKPNYYTVILKEDGSKVFKTDIPNASQEDGEIEEKVLNDIAKAAIDMFEAQRGTLGLGAGATKKSRKGKIMRKTHFLKTSIACEGFETWYMGLKGTAYEQQAYDMLLMYLDKEYEIEILEVNSNNLSKERADIKYQLKKLDIERMKTLPVSTQIIIIKAANISKKAYLYSADDIQGYLDKFTGNPMEAQAVKLVKKFIEIEEEKKKTQQAISDKWAELSTLESQMEQLSMDALYANVIDKVPTEGIEAFPNMAGDIAELMEGVQMDAPLVPTDMGSVLAKKVKKSRKSKKKAFEEAEKGEDRLIELGEYHEGIDIAEVEYPENKQFEKGDKVELTKKVEVPNQGAVKEFPKGSKGCVESLFDGGNLIYNVLLVDDEGHTTLAKVPADSLKKSK